MITNFNDKNRKDDIRILTIIIVVFFFVVWLCTPPGNKLAQMCFYGNNTQFFIAKMTKTSSELDEWKFHHNNAIYLTRMERKKASFKEMDEALRTVPGYVSDAEMSLLYKNRANLKIFWGEYKSALDDYLRVNNIDMTDRLKIALLFKKIGNNKYALSYCNSIVNMDPKAYIGYACTADIYAGVGKYNSSVKVYDILIDRSSNRARYYIDRAIYKKLSGDFDGYKNDINKAKQLSPSVDEEIAIIKEALKPNSLKFNVL